MVRSSRLRIWPLTITDLPSTAAREDSECGSLPRPGNVDMGIPSLARSDGAGGPATGRGEKSSSLRGRFHMIAPPMGISCAQEHSSNTIYYFKMLAARDCFKQP